jgi:hypothetical protein
VSPSRVHVTEGIDGGATARSPLHTTMAWTSGPIVPRTDVRCRCLVCLSPSVSGQAFCSAACAAEAHESMWAVVKDRDSRARAAAWARAHLGLVGPDDLLPPASAPCADGHVHGWMLIDGAWRCAQDFRAAGWAPQTSCGAVWSADDGKKPPMP